MTAAFNKFQIFVQDEGRKVHNLNADVLKVMLTNTAPVNTNQVKADITEISAGNGYTAGGATIGATAYSQTSGTAKLTGNNVVFTASGGTIGPFRYGVLYNSTPSSPNQPLIGWWDYHDINASSPNVTLQDGETFNFNWDATNGILTEA